MFESLESFDESNMNKPIVLEESDDESATDGEPLVCTFAEPKLDLEDLGSSIASSKKAASKPPTIGKQMLSPLQQQTLGKQVWPRLICRATRLLEATAVSRCAVGRRVCYAAEEAATNIPSMA